MKKIISAAFASLLLAACVGDSTVGPGSDGGADADASCSSPKTVCTLGGQSVCTDLTSDTQNCGLCNTVCPSGTSCSASKCVCSTSGQTFCGGKCVDVMTNPQNCGACGNKCINNHCTAGVCDHIVFLSSYSYYVDLGVTGDGGTADPIAVADADCNALATQSQLSGTYKAWLATTTANAPATRFAKSATPYVLPDGNTVVANDWADLTDGTLQHAIDMSEQKIVDPNLATRRTMTNVAPDGTLASPSLDCTGWTSKSSSTAPTIGDSKASTSDWSKMASPDPLWTCALQYHLYCFQQ